MHAGLDPRGLLALDGPLFDAIERVLVEALTHAHGGDVVDVEHGGNGGPPVVGALAFASDFGPTRRR